VEARGSHSGRGQGQPLRLRVAAAGGGVLDRAGGERREARRGFTMTTTAVPHATGIDVPASARTTLVGLLNQRLADMIDLFSQTKHAHWNVKGSSFIALHELFDDVAERVEEHCDLLAERVVALGGTAEGTTRQAASRSAIPEYDLSAVDGDQHVRA